MGVQVAFNYTNWLALFPEFTPPSVGPPPIASGPIPVTSTQADSYFQMATFVHRNDGAGPVNDAGVQLNLLNLLTAHFAKLLATPAGATSAAGFVGRISDAAEGSVHVATEMPTNMPMASAFFTQTQYGLIYWTATAPFRTARYLPNNRNPVNAGTYGGGWYSGGSGWVG